MITISHTLHRTLFPSKALCKTAQSYHARPPMPFTRQAIMPARKTSRVPTGNNLLSHRGIVRDFLYRQTAAGSHCIGHTHTPTTIYQWGDNPPFATDKTSYTAIKTLWDDYMTQVTTTQSLTRRLTGCIHIDVRHDTTSTQPQKGPFLAKVCADLQRNIPHIYMIEYT